MPPESKTQMTNPETPDEADAMMFHILRKNNCEHDFQGWREFEDGRGGERVCTKCGLGAMAHTLSLDI